MLHGRICRERRTPPGSWPCTSPRIAVGPKNARGPRGPAGQCHPSHQHAGARRQGGRLSLSWEKFLLRPLSSLIRLQDLSHWRLTQRATAAPPSTMPAANPVTARTLRTRICIKCYLLSFVDLLATPFLG